MPFLESQLYVGESTIPGAGQGLFTKVFIPKGTRIIQYTGKVTNWENADHQDGLNAYIYFFFGRTCDRCFQKEKVIGKICQ